jgi:hypothetical protein
MRVLLLLCAMCVLQLKDARAGTAYSVRVSGGTFAAQRGQFSVLADSGQIRADAVEKQADAVTLWDSILVVASSPMIALNSENQTWYELEPPSPLVPSSHFLTPLPGATVKNLRMSVSEAGDAGGGEHRYAGQLTYELHATLSGEKVKVTCAASFDVTTTEKQDRRDWPGRMLPVTGYPAVDEKFSAAESAIQGFPLRMSLTVKRTYAGGPPMTETTDVEVLNLREVPVPASSFVRPTDYRHQKPVVGAPGA